MGLRHLRGLADRGDQAGTEGEGLGCAGGAGVGYLAGWVRGRGVCPSSSSFFPFKLIGRDVKGGRAD